MYAPLYPQNENVVDSSSSVVPLKSDRIRQSSVRPAVQYKHEAELCDLASSSGHHSDLPTEHLETAKKLSTTGTTPGLNPAQPSLALPGLGYKHINLNGKAYGNALLSHLTYFQTAQLYTLYLLGYRREAISIVASNVMTKRGLLGLAEDTLTYSTAEIKTIFDVLADEEASPVLVHCTQGKDRTGLTVWLVLALLGAEREGVERDYLLTDRELAPEREEKVRELEAFGLPAEFADCAPGWVEHVEGTVREKYGGVVEYLEHCGVSREQQEAVKRIFGT